MAYLPIFTNPRSKTSLHDDPSHSHEDQSKRLDFLSKSSDCPGLPTKLCFKTRDLRTGRLLSECFLRRERSPSVVGASWHHNEVSVFVVVALAFRRVERAQPTFVLQRSPGGLLPLQEWRMCACKRKRGLGRLDVGIRCTRT